MAYHFKFDRLILHRNPSYEANVEGPFYVTDQCTLCAFPVESAPDNIKWHFTDKCTTCPRSCHVAKQPENDEELRLMIEAAQGSCVEGIRYCGTDPAVLQKFKDIGMERLCDVLQGWRGLVMRFSGKI